METFLRRRGVEEQVIDRLKEDKIDEEIARLMSNEQLEKYIPSPGDVIALKHFLRPSVKDEKTKMKKQSLMEQLKARLEMSEHRVTDNEDNKKTGPKNKNAQKRTHAVELGWLHYNEKKQQFIQVRTRQGGGTRNLSLDKNCTKDDIIAEATNLFFHGGESSYGLLTDMEVELTDFKCHPMDKDETLERILDVAKIRKMRFYLRTKFKNPDAVSEARTPSDLDFTETFEELPDIDADFEDIIRPTLLTKEQDKVTNDTDLSTVDDIEVVENAHTNPVTSTPLTDDHRTVTWEDSYGEIQFAEFVPARQSKQIEIQVHRGHVFEDMIKLFKNKPDIDLKKDIISATVILPNGDKEKADDGGGVMRDILCEFWDSFYEQCTLGTDLKVPCLRHDFEARDWQAVAHVFALGWVLQRMIPIRLAPSFLKCCLYGLNPEISNTSIIEEFLQYVPASERTVLKTALTEFEEADSDELLDVLSNHECKVLVTKDNITTTLAQISCKELVQEPSFIKDAFFSTLIGFGLKIDLEKELGRLRPTTRRVLSILDCPEPDAPSFFHLKCYIRELDDNSLRAFLRFTTSSDLLLLDPADSYYRVTVNLVDLEGLARRPVAHTCGRVLELPKKYESFPVFRAEFNAVLGSNVWVMDIH